MVSSLFFPIAPLCSTSYAVTEVWSAGRTGRLLAIDCLLKSSRITPILSSWDFYALLRKMSPVSSQEDKKLLWVFKVQTNHFLKAVHEASVLVLEGLSWQLSYITIQLLSYWQKTLWTQTLFSPLLTCILICPLR